MTEITTESGQTIWDIAVQEYGDVMAAWIIQEDNPSLFPDLNTDPPGNTKVKIREDYEDGDKELVNHFKLKDITINCQDA